jgi:anaerobic magnesium-protoporphyrin IX monomethyl ester cyclase
MNVLFVFSEQDPFTPEKPLETQERVQFGISYISSLLKQHGHDTRLTVITHRSIGNLDDQVEEFRPDLVCFTSVYSEYAFVAGVARRFKQRHPGIYTALGGPHASLKPGDCMKDGYDAVCVGEGEYATLELVGQLQEGRSPSGIPNLWIRSNGQVEVNPPRPFLEDLDSLPYPDRSLWDQWVAQPAYRPSVLVGRGCPFQCTYCCNHALRRLAPGRYVRFRSPGNIVGEIEEFVARYPEAVQVYLEVETFGQDLGWALELCEELRVMNQRLERPLEFGSNLRVTPRTDFNQLFEAFQRANFRFINIGLESGSERIRREVLKRNYSNDDIIRVVRTARDHDLEVGTYNLIGLPGETRRDFRETIDLNRACQPDWFLLAVFFPYPGSDLYQVAEEQGLLKELPDGDLERRKPVLELPGFSKRQIKRRLTWFAWMIYRGHKPLGAILYVTVLGKVFSNRRLLGIHRARQERKFNKTQ